MLDLSHFIFKSHKYEGVRPGALGILRSDNSQVWMIKFEADVSQPSSSGRYYHDGAIPLEQVPERAPINEYVSAQVIRDIAGAEVVADVSIGHNFSQELLAQIHPQLPQKKLKLCLVSPYVLNSCSLQALKFEENGSVFSGFYPQLNKLNFIYYLFGIVDDKDEHLILNKETQKFFMVDVGANFCVNEQGLKSFFLENYSLKKDFCELMQKFVDYDIERLKLYMDPYQEYLGETYHALVDHFVASQQKVAGFLKWLTNNAQLLAVLDVQSTSPWSKDKKYQAWQLFMSHLQEAQMLPCTNSLSAMVGEKIYFFKVKKSFLLGENIFSVKFFSYRNDFLVEVKSTEHKVGYYKFDLTPDSNINYRICRAFIEKLEIPFFFKKNFHFGVVDKDFWDLNQYEPSVVEDYKQIRKEICERVYQLILQNQNVTFNVVDAGTGCGQLLQAFYENRPLEIKNMKMNFFGFDFNEKNIDHAKDESAKYPFSFYVYDAQNIDHFLREKIEGGTSVSTKNIILASGLMTSLVLPNSYTAAKILQKSYAQADYWVMSGETPLLLAPWIAKAIGYDFHTVMHTVYRSTGGMQRHTLVTLTKMSFQIYLSRFQVTDGCLSLRLCPIPKEIAENLNPEIRRQVKTLDLGLAQIETPEKLTYIIALFENCHTIQLAGIENISADLLASLRQSGKSVIQPWTEYFEYPPECFPANKELRIISPKALQRLRANYSSQPSSYPYLLSTVDYFCLFGKKAAPEKCSDQDKHPEMTTCRI